jgi:hypothetical protein
LAEFEVAMVRYAGLLGLLALVGCFPMNNPEGSLGLVPHNHFGVEPPPPAPTKVNFAPGSEEVSRRVDKIGRDLLAANPQLGLKPLFATIGAPQPEVFHVDTHLVYVTEGLVKGCRTDAEVAAVLAVELGKMVADREAGLSPDIRDPAKMAPIQPVVGSGIQGNPGDFTAMAELGRFEKANPKTPKRLPRPDPQRLARAYLEKGGFQATDLEAVVPLLQAAENNVALERQIKGTMPQSNWTAP